MPLGVQRSRPRHFDNVHSPKGFRAQQLNSNAPPTQSLPRLERQVLDLVYADIAVDRDPLSFHEEIIGRLRVLPLTETGLLAAFWFAPLKQLCAWLNTHLNALLAPAR